MILFDNEPRLDREVDAQLLQSLNCSLRAVLPATSSAHSPDVRNDSFETKTGFLC